MSESQFHTASSHRRRWSHAALLGGGLALIGCGKENGTTAPDAGVTLDPDAGATNNDASAPAGVQTARACSSDGWCWDGAGPHGNTLHAVAAMSSDQLWAVGELGLVLELDGDSWVPRWAPTREHLRAVHARGGEVWAVGDHGTVLRYSDETWHAESIETLDPETDLYGVTGDASGRLWIVGEAGTLLEGEGGGWTLVPTAVTTSLRSVSADQTAAWAVGDAGVLLQRTSESWVRVDAGTGQNLAAVQARDAQIWLVGTSGEVRHFDAEQARFVRPTGEGPAPSGDVLAVQISDEQVYMATSAGNIHVWDAGLTCPVPGDAGAPEQPCPGWGPVRSTGRDLPIHGLWASGSDAVAVGARGSIISFEGPARTTLAEGSSDNYLDVSGTGPADVWVAGDRLLHRSAGSWTAVERDSLRAVYALAALGGGETLVAGTSGMARRLAEDTWQSLDVAADAWLHGLWSDGATGWLVGSRGRTWGLLNRRLWTELDTPTDRDLFAVWGSPAGNVWAVGAGGTTLRHDGALWAAIPSGPDGGVNADLRGLWGSAEDDIWAVGTAGTALHWDGTRWSPVGEPATFSLNDVWGRSPSDVWAVGSGGTILHYDGAAWQPEFSGTLQALHGVWGDGERLWVVGESGSILIKELP